MKIVYKNRHTEKVCTDYKEAKKHIGTVADVQHLQSRIQQIESVVSMQELFRMKNLNLHLLQGDRKGIWSLDVRNRKCPWRLLLTPLDENERPITGGDVFAIAKYIQIVEVIEVSKHYE